MGTIQNYAVEICSVLIVLCAFLAFVAYCYYSEYKELKENKSLNDSLMRLSDSQCIAFKNEALKQQSINEELLKLSKEAINDNKKLLEIAKKWFDYEEQQRKLKDKKQIQAWNQQRDSKGRFAKKGEFVLPEKWKIKINEENVSILESFWNRLLDCDHGVCFGGSLLSNRYDGTYLHYGDPSEYIEITFEQFKKYVLKEV